jgi:hypothetical protein
VAALIAALLFPATALPAGRTATVAVTGQQAGGTPTGAVFSTFWSVPVLNNAGQVAFGGFLATGGGGVTTSNDAGIWRDATLIAREGFQAGGVSTGGVFSGFNGPVLNDLGQSVFSAQLRSGTGDVTSSNDFGIWRDSTLVVREGSQAPGTATGAVFLSFPGSPVVNHAGQIGFEAFLLSGSGGVTTSNDNGIWRDATLIAREGSQAPGAPTGAAFSSFGNPVINGGGQVAFSATMLAGTGGVTTSDDTGIWRDATLLAREGNQAPGTATGVLFASFGTPVLNDVGQTSYFATLSGTGITSENDSGIWRDSTIVAREGNQAPGTATGVVFASFGSPVLNDAGQVTYFATLSGTGIGSVNDSGIWRDSTLVARKGNEAPGTPSGAVFSGFGVPAMNDNGQVAFEGFLRIGDGGVTISNDGGLWIVGTNGDALLVAREGDTLAGRTISSLSILANSGGSDGRGRAINEFGQLAYRASFTDGAQGIFLFTPELRWIRTFSSSWDTRSNWTIGQAPGAVHDVRIDPDISLTVTGPTAEVIVNSLTVGGGNGIATLSLNGGELTSTAGPVQILATGVLTGDGQILSAVTNLGTVRAQNVTILGGLTNQGLVEGNGRLNARITNASTGRIQVEAGQTMVVTSPAGTHSNSGRIEVRDGVLEITGALTNGTAGQIILDGGLVRFNGGLSNSGQLLVGFGGASVFGAITNNTGGRIILSGNSETTFYDAVVNNGELRVSPGSFALFFGNVSGTGTFTGTGTKFYEALFSPGSSPGLVTDAGDSSFGPGAVVEMELAGLLPGTQHDKFEVAGTLSLGGTLKLVLLEGFAPQLGDRFDLFDWGVLDGRFAAFDTTHAALAPGLAWSFADLYTTGEIHVAAVPEPGTWAMMLAGLGLLVGAARWRGRKG